MPLDGFGRTDAEREAARLAHAGLGHRMSKEARVEDPVHGRIYTACCLDCPEVFYAATTFPAERTAAGDAALERAAMDALRSFFVLPETAEDALRAAREALEP